MAIAPAQTPNAGALLIGFLLNTGLFGILLIQTYTYHVSFPNDRILLKLLVDGIFVAEIAQTSLSIYDAYSIFVTGFGNASAFESPSSVFWAYSPLICGTLILIIHLFYAHRICILYKSRIIGMIISIFSIAQFIAALVSAVYIKEQQTRGFKVDGHYISFLIWAGASLLCDTPIAILMTLRLVYWGDIGDKHTRTTVSKLLRMSIETGLVLATLAIVDLILLVGFPKKTYFLAIFITVSKWHSVTWLASLNNRSRSQHPEASVPTMDIQFQATSTGTRTDTQLGLPVPVTLDLTPPHLVRTNSIGRYEHKWGGLNPSINTFGDQPWRV
ncbi:hypothetical protein BD779DRAFT_823927 [Infundibulicybe gibba]|nr:hypothetical protein BD779DRAFT_823927 [Infundibulicybe gibba]